MTTQEVGPGERSAEEKVYDALVVCNGHYSQPRLPQVEGQNDFPGLIMHSHNYRCHTLETVTQTRKGLWDADVVFPEIAEPTHCWYECI